MVIRSEGSTIVRDGALAKTHHVLSLVTNVTLLANILHCTVVGISSIRTVIATAICCATHAPFANVSKATLTVCHDKLNAAAVHVGEQEIHASGMTSPSINVIHDAN